MAKKVLEVKSLSKVYKGIGYQVTALDKVSFELNHGELLAIMGTSGSGKSTLLNILGALDDPSSGKVILNGKETNDFFKEPKATVYRRDKIGFIFQSFNLLKDLTVKENVELPLVLKGKNKKESDQKVEEMLKLVGLTKWKKHRPIQLSGGQQQRVAIARALITSPPIVLADELTGNLDFNTTKDILNVLVDMKKRLNKSMIIVTHDPNVALYSDRVLFFHDGHIVDEYKSLGQGDLPRILNKFQKIMERDQ
ncbi:ABC transporter ATP-binding protein [Bacillus subtilis]|uniref:ABC transporter ATP-binding protein n=1 Tax=Bacillus subtilis TaxID=1423 RepID=A0AAX3RVL5_BACIU|nr:ABC transporter ATP-binding protein [Bacillus subtilis]OTQ85334.1 ABC transporter ATP-binding protein [Bacillus subtilis subsp. subtilis]UQZ57391.1 ABC transporter ATP-binding protein [Bacillus subtilis]WEY89255.1 ABC transporter ATP-binding protein [Bacillus subtilis]WEZ20697.1 ABC transporter ATP-binding protein [Bacillus subtilis]CCU60042.1 ABC transporter ATP-binding protein YvcR [Bacillus subtilis E1]